MWRGVVFCALAFFALGAWGQAVPVLGNLSGSVKLDTGEPRINVPVTVTIDNGGQPLTYNLKTDDKGEFAGVVRAGKGRISAEGMTKDITVTDDPAGLRVDFVLEMKGLVVEMVFPDGTPSLTNPTCCVWMPEGNRNLNARRLAENKFWFPDIPANATEIGLRAGLMMGAVIIQRWKLEAPITRQTYRFVLPKTIPVDFTITDENGAPVKQTQIRFTLESTVSGGPDGWTPTITTPMSQTSGVSSNENGVARLTMPPGKYRIRMRAGEKAGPSMAFTVEGDIPQAALQYSLNVKPRTVSQVIFDDAKKPAAGVRVFATYALNGTATYLTAVTDAAGKVTWENLPPVKTIVWGEGVPAGMMNGDEQEITAPLPALVVEKNRYGNLQMKLDNLPADATRAAFAVTSSQAGRDLNTNSVLVQDGKVTFTASPIAPGGRFSMFIMADGTPPRFAYLENLYCPFLDDVDGAPTLTVPLSDGALLRCALQMPDGTPVPALSKLSILTVKTDAPLPGMAKNPVFKDLGLSTLRSAGGGKYTAYLPGPGQYRLLVDLFDASSPTPPQLQLMVKAGVNEVAINLPAPLATVPGGTVFSWLTPGAPSAPRRLVIAAGAEQMPVFGPAEGLFCAWYRATPNRLTVLRPGANGLAKTELALRTVTLKGTDAQGGMRYWQMCSLFPNRAAGYASTFDRPNDTETQETAISPSGTVANLWSAPYPGYNNDGQMSLFSIDVPADANEITPKLPPYNGNRPNPITSIHFVFPAYDYAKVRSGGGNMADRITLQYDVSMPRNYGGGSIYPGGFSANQPTADANAPIKATKVSLFWPGVGAIRNVALPALGPNPNGNQAMVTLPNWEDGTTVSGTILRADGTPWAKKRNIFVLPRSRTDSGVELNMTTDDAGKFMLKGIPQGILNIFPQQMDGSYEDGSGWVLNVPETGLKDVTLKFSDSLFRVQINNMQYQSVWWVPDAGAPQPIASRYSTIRSFDMPAGSGRLWCVSPDGNALLEQMTLPSGNNITIDGNYAGREYSSPLGLRLPLDLNAPMPGTLTLVGQGSLAGLTAEFNNLRWCPSALLNCIVAQIDAVPPGKWLLRLERGDAIIERTIDVGQQGGVVNFE